jgi:hypothetical protein
MTSARRIPPDVLRAVERQLDAEAKEVERSLREKLQLPQPRTVTDHDERDPNLRTSCGDLLWVRTKAGRRATPVEAPQSAPPGEEFVNDLEESKLLDELLFELSVGEGRAYADEIAPFLEDMVRRVAQRLGIAVTDDEVRDLAEMAYEQLL